MIAVWLVALAAIVLVSAALGWISEKLELSRSPPREVFFDSREIGYSEPRTGIQRIA
jgi:hypothetical protein